MERRVLIAITLSFLVLFLFSALSCLPASAPAAYGSRGRYGGAGPCVPQRAAGNERAGGTATPARLRPRPQAPGPRPRREPTSLSETPPSARSSIETTTVRAVFTNRGARLLHWTLKAYKNDLGTPLELVPQKAGANAVKPFSLAGGRCGRHHAVELGALSRRRARPATASTRRRSRATITFEMSTNAGSEREEVLHVPARRLSRVVRRRRRNRAAKRLNPDDRVGPGPRRRHRAGQAGVVPVAELQHAGAGHRAQGRQGRTASAGDSPAPQDGPFRYAGVDDHYFVSMVVNQDAPVPLHVQYTPVIVPQPDVPGMTGRYVGYGVKFADAAGHRAVLLRAQAVRRAARRSTPRSCA